MATKSFMKNVMIRQKPLAQNFIRAVENAQNKHSKVVVMTKSIQEIHGEALKKIFGK